jgi:hypothetical protein
MFVGIVHGDLDVGEQSKYLGWKPIGKIVAIGGGELRNSKT